MKLIGAASEVTDPALGFPNLINHCNTCGAKDRRECEGTIGTYILYANLWYAAVIVLHEGLQIVCFAGHFGLINFPFTILNPYFLPEVAQILNKICPACKSVHVNKVKVRYYAPFSNH